MPMIQLTNLSQYGVVKDVQDFLLPVNAWTDARNVHFRDQGVTNVGGSEAVFDISSIAPPFVPYWTMQCFLPLLENAWIVAGLTQVYANINGANVDISRITGGAYAATEDSLWVGGVLGGIPVLNNGVNAPQQWGPISGAVPLIRLDNWPTGWRCASIRPFKNFLIAMNLLEDAERYIHRVRWSHPAVPGAVPSSWDALDPTVDAGRFDLSDVQNGPLLDGAQLRDVFILLKEKSTWGMQFIGGRSKFRVFPIAESSGVLSKNCMTLEPKGLFLFIATGEDIVLCDGQQITSLLDKRMRRWLTRNMNTERARRSFCVTDTIEGECWFCFPTESSDWPNLALVWNKSANSLSFRDIDALSYASAGPLSAIQQSWDSEVGSWDEETGAWDELRHQAFLRPLVGVSPKGGEALSLDTAQSQRSAYFERTGLSAFGLSRDGQPVSDLTKRKLIRRVYVQGRGGTVQVRVSTQERIGRPVKWSGPRSYNLDSRIAADFHQQGVLWGIRIESAERFEIDHISVEVEELGGAF